MNRLTALTVAVVTLTLGACAEHPGEQKSVRATIADWIAPPGYTPDGGPARPMGDPQQSQIVQNAYQSDMARQQAGGQSVMVSQVTIHGGQVNVRVGGGFSMDTEWRPAGGVVSATVAECESVAVTVPRGDKPGGAMIYLTRVNGIVFASQFGSGGCQVPAQAQSFPGHGRFPLSIQGRVQGATITISGWGSGVGYPMPDGYYQGKPYR